MNPREQACAAVRHAQERRDTRALAKAAAEACRVTHKILGPAVASTVPAASLGGKLFSQALAQLRGRS